MANHQCKCANTDTERCFIIIAIKIHYLFNCSKLPAERIMKNLDTMLSTCQLWSFSTKLLPRTIIIGLSVSCAVWLSGWQSDAAPFVLYSDTFYHSHWIKALCFPKANKHLAMHWCVATFMGVPTFTQQNTYQCSVHLLEQPKTRWFPSCWWCSECTITDLPRSHC